MTVLNPGTPDNTRGYVSPQKLLATFGPTDQIKTVAVPNNAGSVWVLAPGVANTNTLFVSGATSAADYPAYQIIPVSSTGNDSIWIIPTVEAIDGDLSFVWSSSPGHTWYVVSDASSRWSVAALMGSSGQAIATDSGGEQFVVPTAPGANPGDHPANELVIYPFNGSLTTAPSTLAAAPGVGKRYRIFYGKLWIYGTPTDGCEMFVDGGDIIALCGYVDLPNSDEFSYPQSGLPLNTNTGVFVQAVTSTVSAAGYVLATIETV